MSLNPDNVSAQRGLESLQKVMRDLDPNCSSNASHANESSLDHNDDDVIGTSAVGVGKSAVY